MSTRVVSKKVILDVVTLFRLMKADHADVRLPVGCKSSVELARWLHAFNMNVSFRPSIFSDDYGKDRLYGFHSKDLRGHNVSLPQRLKSLHDYSYQVLECGWETTDLGMWLIDFQTKADAWMCYPSAKLDAWDKARYEEAAAASNGGLVCYSSDREGFLKTLNPVERACWDAVEAAE